MRRCLLLALALLLVACEERPSEAARLAPVAGATRRVVEQLEPTPRQTRAPASATTAPTRTPAPTATPEPTSTPTSTPTLAPTATPTPNPLAWITIEALRGRAYGTEGQIERVAVMEQNGAFTRYLIRYPSEGIAIGGFMNVPVGPGPFPVIIVAHGYMPPGSYETLTYTTPYADALARAGYLVLHPNYRNHRGSEFGPNPFRAGYAIDVLNLIQLAKKLPEARPDAIGLWGHSMGGGITLRVLAVTDQVRAAVVYGSMSADEAENYRQLRRWLGNTVRVRSFGFPISPDADPALYAQISPINAIAAVSAAVSVHHGERDVVVPLRWSQRLQEALLAAGRTVEFYTYAGQGHNFEGPASDLLVERSVAFFDSYLRSQAASGHSS